MMPLHTLRDSDEFTEMLKGVSRLVKKEVMELHSSEDDDRHYMFIFWPIDLDDSTKIAAQIRRNLDEIEQRDEDWSYCLFCFNGLIVVNGTL